ncbi:MULTISPECIES: serine hydrolase domain-containing protein [Kitasatospora]|uniref:Putative esterase n=1 Tax=Kitasatospora setae (strain ATCC 33774 / DSM 43861 / JCM 3304 / KCC A-0304 / NBRC 14216 / KM-6054) TaxID=452652 RepID=E4N4Y2_KITSK|nr:MULTISPECIES: serine hydrolase domain-containing protein [Kitasatospora]BAJ26263.1 putative esterase [Kitasatospora setae KM-6054]
MLERWFADGVVPGAVALVAREGQIEAAAVGELDRESPVRIASVGKPVTAALVLQLVDDGVLALDDPVERWLPELADRRVVRTPGAPVTDTVPAVRPFTVRDVLESRAGYGFPADFTLPALAPLVAELGQGPPQPQRVAPPDEWTATLAGIPMLHQPGEAWLYNTCSDLQGVLAARATGQPLEHLLAERLFEPLGMPDTGFHAPPGSLSPLYRPGPDGTLMVADPPDGQWSTPPPFPSGAGGLVSTLDDVFTFLRMLRSGGRVKDGRRVLSPHAVRLMTTDHLSDRQRADSKLFLAGQGWGYGGSVDVARREPWNVPGRYGWVGGTGTAAHVVRSTGLVTVLLTQREMTDPTPPPLMREFWRYAAGG